MPGLPSVKGKHEVLTTRSAGVGRGRGGGSGGHAGALETAGRHIEMEPELAMDSATRACPVEVKQSVCTLCRNGCGLKVRMAEGWPVGVAGVASHPVTHGALCPLGFGAHQLNWHPQRLRTVRHHGVLPPGTNPGRRSRRHAEGRVVVIDGYPGRAASAVLEAFAERRGEYRVVRGTETRALTPYEEWSGTPAESLGYDIENAGTILSFGAPVLDGWGVPGRFTRLWAERAAGQAEPQMRVVQVESSISRTAGRLITGSASVRDRKAL